MRRAGQLATLDPGRYFALASVLTDDERRDVAALPPDDFQRTTAGAQPHVLEMIDRERQWLDKLRAGTAPCE